MHLAWAAEFQELPSLKRDADPSLRVGSGSGSEGEGKHMHGNAILIKSDFQFVHTWSFLHETQPFDWHKVRMQVQVWVWV